MKTIVVAIDFSPITPHLLLALEAVANPESKVYLVHVAAPEPDFVGFGVGPQYIRDDRALELREEHKQLGSYKTHLHKKGLNVEALLVSGPTVQTILNEVEKLHADLLIIGRKGHFKLYEVVLGSVCKDVLHKLTIPALLIPNGK
jgi:nucleotide-binding universal stress UspA family protein